MPKPSSSAPRSVSPSIRKVRFTLAEANKTLPLVRKIVGDVVKTHDQAHSLKDRVDQITDGKDRAKVQVELDAAMNKLRGYVTELTDIGCELKDSQSGLIDFVGQHQGREVYLCWRLGEDRIHFWHELTAGVAGRKPIATLDERD